MTDLLQAYTSSSNVVLLTPELELLDTLEFWSALPPRAAGSSGQGVHGVRCVDGLVSCKAFSDHQ